MSTDINRYYPDEFAISVAVIVGFRSDQNRSYVRFHKNPIESISSSQFQAGC